MLNTRRPKTVLATLALLLAACTESHPAAPPAASAPPPFPTIYNPELQLRHLSPSQFHEIQSRATHAHAAHIWFVYIAENDGTHYRATAYFVPTSHDGRVYHGQSANFLSASRDELDFMEKAGMSTVAIDSYTYVTGHPVTDATVPPPSEITFPFRTPERIPDADLPKILDAARSIFAQHPNTPTMPPLPVHNIVTEPNGNIRVFFGSKSSPLSSHGIQIELQRHDNDFIIIHATDWVS